jgi:exodeoxyribonuclease VII small subunit
VASKRPAPADAESFEALFAELEEKARRLEEGNLPLEESLALYEAGAALVARLRVILEAAELRIRNVQTPQESGQAAGMLREDGEDWDEDGWQQDEE